VIFTGSTFSSNFPVSTGAFQSSLASSGSYDGIVVKLNSQGGRLWATYFGGNNYDWGSGIACDTLNNIYFSGATASTNLPVTTGAYQTTFGGGTYDMFFARFDSSGARVWVSYYGGPGYEYGQSSIGIDSASNIYIAGGTTSTGLATTGAYQTTMAGIDDAVLAKFSSTGARIWVTYFGGSGSEYYSSGVRVDRNNNVILAGATTSSDLPVTTGAYQTSLSGAYDEFIVKFTSNGTRLWATYYGGSGQDYGGSVTTDLDSNIIITGYTSSTNLPGTAGGFQTSYGGGVFDGFIAKFTAAGAFRWSSYCGGNNYDWMPAVSTDAGRNIVFSGYTYSSNFSVTANAYQSTMGGLYDAVILKVDSSGHMLWSTFFGGSNYEYAYGIAIDRNAIYITGSTISTDFPITSGAFQTTHGGGSYDFFVSKFCDIAPEFTVAGPTTFCPGDSVILTASPGYDSYHWSNNATTRTITVKQEGDYYVTATLGACSGTSDTVHVTVYRTTRPVITHGTTVFCPGDSTTLSIPPIYRSQRWSTGATNTQIVIRDSGQYYIDVVDTNGCRMRSDTVTVRMNPKPDPKITPAGTRAICAGDTIELDAGPGYRLYLWRPGGQTSQKIRVAKAGVYSVEVENEFYCRGTSQPVTITINPRPDSTITALRPRVFCDGDSTVLSGPPGLTYKWTRNNTVIGTTRMITLKTEGKVTLTVTDTSGCTASSSIQVQIEPSPWQAISAFGATSLCQGDSVVLDAGENYQNYKWSTGATTQRIVVRQAGRYWVKFQSLSGCPGESDTVTVTVSPKPSAVITGPISVCANALSTYAVTERPGLKYKWVVTGNGSVQGASDGFEAKVQWGASGTGKVYVTVTDPASGCSSAQEMSVSLGTGVQPAITGRTHFCPDSTIELDAGPGYASYKWSTGATSRKIFVSTAGTYTVMVADAAGCSGSSLPFTVTQSASPAPTIAASGSLSLCPGAMVDLDAGDYATYRWSSGETTQHITVSAAGTYTVTVTDSLGCPGVSAPVTIVAKPAPAPGIDGPNAVCLNSTRSYSVTDVPGDSYQWTVSSEGTIIGPSTGSTIQVQWTAAGIGTVDLTQTASASGCSGRAQQMLVDIGTQLNPTILPAGPVSLCEGDSTVLTAPGGYDIYNWSTGATTRSIAVRAAGSYSVQVADASGICTGTSAPVEVTMLPLPVVNITPTDTIRLCPGDSAMLSGDAGFAEYHWSNGMTTRQISVHDTGSYWLMAVNSDGCRGNSQSVQVIIYPAPATPVVTVAGDTLTSTPGVTYQWYMEGAPVTGATQQQYITSVYGNYTVATTDTNGCRAVSLPATLAPPDVMGSSLVELDEYEAVPGEHLHIPLQLAGSQKLDEAGAHEYMTRIRFFKHLLYPAGTTPRGEEDGNYRVITLTGTRPNGMQLGELCTMELVAALADTLETPLEIEEFVWQDGKVTVQKRNGKVRITPEGGWTRYRPEGRMMLCAPRPNPAVEITAINYETVEPGHTRLYITDMMGGRALTLLDEETTPGLNTVLFDASLLPSGSYFIILQTPSARAIQPLEVEH
jgi:hypothetical protein